MLITLQDDGVLYVYDSAEEAVRDVETLESEDSFHAVYDDRGQGYTLQRARRKSIFGLLKKTESSAFFLAPSGGVDKTALLRTIARARTIAPRAAVPKVGKLVDRLANGVN